MEQKWIAALRLARRYLPPVVLAQGRNTVAEQVVPPQERSKVVAQVVQPQAHNTAAVAVQVVAAAHYITVGCVGVTSTEATGGV